MFWGFSLMCYIFFYTKPFTVELRSSKISKSNLGTLSKLY